MTLEDWSFTDVASYSNCNLYVTRVKDITLKNTVVKNYTSTVAPVFPFLLLSISSEAIFNLDGLVVENADFVLQSFISVLGIFKEINVQNIHFTDVQVLTESNLFYSFGVEDFSLRNVTSENVRATVPTDTESSIFFINSLVLSNNNNVSISEVDYKNSSLTFIKYAGFSGSPPSKKYFTFDDMNFAD